MDLAVWFIAVVFCFHNVFIEKKHDFIWEKIQISAEIFNWLFANNIFMSSSFIAIFFVINIEYFALNKIQSCF